MTRSDTPEYKREASRRYRRRHREAISRRRAELRHQKISREGGLEAERLRNLRICHGANYLEIFALMWEQQDGCCYLCGDPLNPGLAVIDHDHACCRPTRSCDACRRGLACQRCNRLIGQFGDDPEQMRRMAEKLETAVKAARARIASKPIQLEMLGAHDRSMRGLTP